MCHPFLKQEKKKYISYTISHNTHTQTHLYTINTTPKKKKESQKTEKKKQKEPTTTTTAKKNNKNNGW